MSVGFTTPIDLLGGNPPILRIPSLGDKIILRIKTVYDTCVRWKPLVIDGVYCLANVANIEIWGAISDLISCTFFASKGKHVNIEWLPKIASSLKVSVVVSVIFAFGGFLKDLYIAYATFGMERWDACLNAATNAGWLGESVTTSAWGAEQLKLLENVSNWAIPVACVSAILSAVAIVINGLSWYQGNKLIQHLNNGPTNSIRLQEFLDNTSNYSLQKHFLVGDGKILRESIKEIADRSLFNASQADKARDMIGTLKERVRTKNWSHALVILSSVVGLIGVGVLFFSPLSSIAYTILAVSSIIAVAKFFYERKAAQSFESQMKLIQIDPTFE